MGKARPVFAPVESLSARGFLQRYTRRTFLKKTLAAGLAAPLPFLANCGQGAEPPTKSSSGLALLIVSPTGISEYTGHQERILIRNASGSFAFDPSISPDGAQIAYIRQPPAKRVGDVTDVGSDLMVAKRDGGSPRELIRHLKSGEFLASPLWSRNGQEILFSRLGLDGLGQPHASIESIALSSNAVVRIASNGVAPALSPDAEALAFVQLGGDAQTQQIALLNMKSRSMTLLMTAESGLTQIGSLDWSPDGSQLAFSAANPMAARRNVRGTALIAETSLHPTLQDVWLVRRDGTELRLLADLAEDRPSVSWSRDGYYVYVLVGAGLMRIDISTKERELVNANISGTQVRVIHDR